MPSPETEQERAVDFGERATVFRQNISNEFERLRWARSATKHRISGKRIRHVLEHCLAILEVDPPAGHPKARGTRLIFLGEDPTGVALEVIAVETDEENLLVIHAMRLRSRYRGAYEEMRKCSR
jgi:hypothetical protein